MQSGSRKKAYEELLDEKDHDGSNIDIKAPLRLHCCIFFLVVYYCICEISKPKMYLLGRSTDNQIFCVFKENFINSEGFQSSTFVDDTMENNGTG